jgi:hypothetical protein
VISDLLAEAGPRMANRIFETPETTKPVSSNLRRASWNSGCW